MSGRAFRQTIVLRAPARKLLFWLLVGVVPIVVSRGLPIGSSPAAESATPDRKVVFVQGMNSEAACDLADEPEWAGLANYLIANSGGLYQADDFLGFSYSGQYCASGAGSFNGFAPSYSKPSTCGSIDPAEGTLGHSQRFGLWFATLPGDGVTYDIITHSMGGVVVAYWAALLATNADVTKVHSIIALDSPLRGIPNWEQWAAELAASYGFLECPPGDDRYADMGQESAVTSAIQNRTTAGRAASITVRNTEDLIVSSGIASMPKVWLDRLFEDACDGTNPIPGGHHGCVFTNPTSLDAIVRAALHAGEPPEGQATNDWPMSRHDPAKTGFNSSESVLTPPLALKWVIPGPQADFVWSAMSQPVVDAGYVYFEGSRLGAYGLFGYDAATGQETGHVGDFKDPPCNKAGVHLNRDEPEAPAVVGDNIYYVGGPLGSASAPLSAYRKSDGQCLWQQYGSNGWDGSPLPVNNYMWAFKCSTFPPGSAPAAFDPQSGQLVGYLGFTSWFPASYSNGSFHFSQGCGGAGVETVDDVTGLRKWWRSDGPYISSPVWENGVVYATGRDFEGDMGIAEALDAVTGETLWRYEQLGNLFRHFPAIASGVLYFGSQDGTFYALNSTDPLAPSVQWTRTTGGPINSAPAVANGVAYWGSNDGVVYAANALTGAPLWSYQTPCAVDGPMVVANGVLYVRGNSLQGGWCRPALYAFESDGDGDGIVNSQDPDDDNDGDPDSTDLDDDNDRVHDVDEGPCGANPVSGTRRPERLDGAFAGVDDDGDTSVDEALPGGSEGYDCDGDGWTGVQERLILNASDPPPNTRHDQDPCGNNGWPADLQANNRLDIGDFGSFLFPKRTGDNVDAHGDFNYFGHPLDDDGDTAIETAETPNADGGPDDPPTYNVARWNLAGGNDINIGDLNALNPAVIALTSRPPMFGGQPAFFTDVGNGVGGCPWPP